MGEPDCPNTLSTKSLFTFSCPVIFNSRCVLQDAWWGTGPCKDTAKRPCLNAIWSLGELMTHTHTQLTLCWPTNAKYTNVWWEIWWHFKWFTYDDMEWCSVMISVPKIHVMKLRVMIFKLSIEIDNWRIKKDDFDFNFDFDCAFELSIETDKRRDWWR